MNAKTKINAMTSNGNGKANRLVRIQHVTSHDCFHVSINHEDNEVEVFCAGDFTIKDLVNTKHPVINAEESFKEALSSKSDASQAEKILAVLREFPFRTTQELAAKVNPAIIDAAAIHKRLPELRKRGLVRNVEYRPCTVSGRKAFTWAPVEA